MACSTGSRDQSSSVGCRCCSRIGCRGHAGAPSRTGRAVLAGAQPPVAHAPQDERAVDDVDEAGEGVAVGEVRAGRRPGRRAARRTRTRPCRAPGRTWRRWCRRRCRRRARGSRTGSGTRVNSAPTATVPSGGAGEQQRRARARWRSGRRWGRPRPAACRGATATSPTAATTMTTSLLADAAGEVAGGVGAEEDRGRRGAARARSRWSAASRGRGRPGR